MDEMDADYNNYWETRMFFENDELESWGLDEVFADVYDLSSPNGDGSSDNVGSLGVANSSSSLDDKNIIMERNRRKKFNERLYALRSLVPNITKMDKVSIIQDAISYIKDLQEQERRMLAEITELELSRDDQSAVSEINQDDQLVLGSRTEIKRTTASSSLLHEKLSIQSLKVREVGERTLIVSFTCTKRRDPMIKLCKLFESLKLKIMSANVLSLSGSLLHTLYVETNGMKSDQLKEMIEFSILELDDSRCVASYNEGESYFYQ